MNIYLLLTNKLTHSIVNTVTAVSNASIKESGVFIFLVRRTVNICKKSRWHYFIPSLLMNIYGSSSLLDKWMTSTRISVRCRKKCGSSSTSRSISSFKLYFPAVTTFNQVITRVTKKRQRKSGKKSW